MYPNQQQSVLPVSHTQLQFQFQNFGPGNLPPIPAMNTNPAYQPVVGPMAVALVNAVQSNAQKNALRTFAFNLYARDGFCNEDFFRMVANAMDWLEMAVEQRQFQSVQHALSEIPSNYAEMAACAQLRNWPALTQVVDANTYQAAQRVIQYFDQLGNQIAQFKHMKQQMQYQQPGMGGGYPQGGFMPGAMQGGMPPQGNFVRATTLAPGGSSLFNAQPAPPAFTPSGQQQTESFDRFSSHVTSVGEQQSKKSASRIETVRGDAMYQQPQRDPAVTQTLSEVLGEPEKVSNDDFVLADESKWIWKPSASQPYPFAYNPRTHLKYHRRNVHGDIIEFIKERVRDTVDYEKHRLVQSFGPAARTIDPIQTQLRLQRMQDSLVQRDREDPTLSAEELALIDNRVFPERWITESTLEDAWVACSIGRWHDAVKGKLPDIYHRRARVATPVVSSRDESSLVAELSQQTTYSELRRKLLEMRDKASPELWYLCERRMTDAVNRVLNQQFSIDTITISSFVGDILDLPAVLEKRFGEAMVKQYRANEAQSIQNTFRVLQAIPGYSTDLAAAFNEVYLVRETEDDPEMEEEGPSITYLATDVTMTFLSCVAQELEVELSSKHASLVTSETPFLRALVEDIMVNVKDDLPFDHHFIRTIDGHILELTRGLLGQDAYLLRIVR